MNHNLYNKFNKKSVRKKHFGHAEVLEGRQLLAVDGFGNDLGDFPSAADPSSTSSLSLKFTLGLAAVTIASFGVLFYGHSEGVEVKQTDCLQPDENSNAHNDKVLQLEVKTLQESLTNTQNDRDMLAGQLKTLKKTQNELQGTQAEKAKVEAELKILRGQLEKSQKAQIAAQNELSVMKNKNVELEGKLNGLQVQIKEFEAQGCEFYLVV